MNLQQVKQRFGIIGNSARLNYALETAVKVAPTDITVYIQGESGVGKESFSKIIHHLSNRKHGTFIAINCGAIPEGTINSELFGHEKGAFTGAVDTRKGYFETANGGTIFLDEVGELPLETQSRLLRVLENGEFLKVGSSKVQKTDVRIITATNKNLMQEAINGKFREDLYYRISTLPIKVPALRERPEDIVLLFKKFVFDFSEKYRSGEIDLTPEAQEILIRHRWPGNIRQLKNVAEQMAVLENSGIIDEETLRMYLPPSGLSNLPATIPTEKKSDNGFSERDIFYKILLDMKNDMNDLKKIVLELLKDNNNKEEIIENNEAVLQRVLSSGDERENSPSELIIQRAVAKPTTNEPKPSPSISHNETEDEEDHHYVIEPSNEVGREENLSLEDKEKELIQKALLRNNGRRKKAADDLGISERTLYRKIKQYEIPD